MGINAVCYLKLTSPITLEVMQSTLSTIEEVANELIRDYVAAHEGEHIPIPHTGEAILFSHKECVPSLPESITVYVFNREGENSVPVDSESLRLDEDSLRNHWEVDPESEGKHGKAMDFTPYP